MCSGNHYNFSLQFTSFGVSTVYFGHTQLSIMRNNPMLLFITSNKYLPAEKQHKLVRCIFRSSRPEVLIGKDGLKIYNKFTGEQKQSSRSVLLERCSQKFCKIYRKKTCARISFLIKLQVWACNFIKKEALACNFVKKETLAQVFSSEFYEISKNTFFCRTAPVAASEENEQPCKSVIS